MTATENLPDIYRFSCCFDVVRAAIEAMREHDARFQLHPDFFERDVVSVPGQ